MTITLELYGAQTGNCIRAAIALEEAGLSYTPRLVDLSSGAQRGVDHLALNPAGKVPVLVEKEEGREPFVLAQSNAIILYAADKAGDRLLPGNDRDRAIVLERFFFFVTDVIVVSHAAFSLRGATAQEAETILMNRALATLATAERYVADSEFMAGETFSAADIAAFTITQSMKSDLPWPSLPNLRSWFERIEGRSSVKRGLKAFDRTSSARPILQPGPDHPIAIEPHQGPLTIRAGGHVIAMTNRALVLREASYPAVYYVPRGDARMDLLARSPTTSWRPYKGEACYFSIPSLGEAGVEAVWTYEHPNAPAARVADYLAFFADRVSIENERS